MSVKPGTEDWMTGQVSRKCPGSQAEKENRQEERRGLWGSSRVGAAPWEEVSGSATGEFPQAQHRIFHHGTWNPCHRQKTCADRMPHGTR